MKLEKRLSVNSQHWICTKKSQSLNENTMILSSMNAQVVMCYHLHSLTSTKTSSTSMNGITFVFLNIIFPNHIPQASNESPDERWKLLDKYLQIKNVASTLHQLSKRVIKKRDLRKKVASPEYSLQFVQNGYIHLYWFIDNHPQNTCQKIFEENILCVTFVEVFENCFEVYAELASSCDIVISHRK